MSLTRPLRCHSGVKAGARSLVFTHGGQNENLSSRSGIDRRSQPHNGGRVGCVCVGGFLHAYHHNPPPPPPPPARAAPLREHACSQDSKTDRQTDEDVFKDVSWSCCCFLPPLNTAGESQDCAAVAGNDLRREICEGNECRAEVGWAGVEADGYAAAKGTWKK